MCSMLVATPATPKKKRQATATTSGAASHKRKHAGTASKATTTRGSKTASVNAKRRGKKSRTLARYYQQAPTPERYKEIQQALASKGFFQGEANGEWGPDSVDALKRFQTSQNLTADGKINSLSLIALGLGPKHLTASTNPAPQQPGTLTPSPAAPAQPTPAPPPSAPPQ